MCWSTKNISVRNVNLLIWPLLFDMDLDDNDDNDDDDDDDDNSNDDNGI